MIEHVFPNYRYANVPTGFGLVTINMTDTSILRFVSRLARLREAENAGGNLTARRLRQTYEKLFKATQPVILMTRGDTVTGAADF